MFVLSITLAIMHCSQYYRTLAEQMGGSISFTDNVPHGTVMVLRIPQRQAPAAAAPPAAAAAAATPTTAATAAAATAATPAAAAVSSTEQTASSTGSCEQSTELPLPLPPLSKAAVAENERLLRTKRVLVRATHLHCFVVLLATCEKGHLITDMCSWCAHSALCCSSQYSSAFELHGVTAARTALHAAFHAVAHLLISALFQYLTHANSLLRITASIRKCCV
jgi:hypothetical protein